MRRWIENYESHQLLCCNPFLKHAPSTRVKGQYTLTLAIRDKAKVLGLALVPGKKLCTSCKIRLHRDLKETGPTSAANDVTSSPSLPSSQSAQSGTPQSGPSSSQNNSTPSQGHQDHGSPRVAFPLNLHLVNEWLVTNEEEPIDVDKLKKVKSYGYQQLNKFHRVLQTILEPDLVFADNVENWHVQFQLFVEGLDQLKTCIQSCKGNGEKITVLTALPQSWSVRQVKKHFDVSKRMVKKAKLLVREKGFLSSPNKKEGKKLSDETVNAVKDFFYRQDVSKEMAGKSNVVTVKENGEKVKKTKRLVLANLRHLHDEFRKMHPECELSFSKFAELRPKECVLATGTGMHNVCVCTIHQNPQLMFEGANLKSFTEFSKATDCLKMLLCPSPKTDCHLRTCEHCPDSTALQEILGLNFDEEMVESVTYNQWETVDRTNIFTKTSTSEDFIEEFIFKLEQLIPHHFLFRAQAGYFETLKKQLKEDEVMVIGDFAENFTFIVQDSIQSYYFSSGQATIHPFSCYFKDPATAEIKQISLSVISDCMDKSAATVYTFQKSLIEVLKNQFPTLTKIHYFSNGSSGEYKNRYNVANIWHHFKDFGIHAIWNFFATSHGKSACDGIGGTIKRLATLFCLKHTEPGSQITTPRRLYEWAVSNIANIRLMWVSSEDVKISAKFLEIRFLTAKSIDGIRSAHSIEPCVDEKCIIAKRFSQAATGEKFKISDDESGVRFEDVRGFVTTWDKGEPVWKLAYVVGKNDANQTVQLQFLTKLGGKKFDYKFTSEENFFSVECILTLAQPIFRKNGTIVKMLAADAKNADVILSSKIAK